MTPKTTNNSLIVRALERGPGADPCVDFTTRVMERIAQDEAVKNRRENRILLVGTLCCCVGLIFVATILVRLYAGQEFSKLGSVASGIWISMGEVFGGVGMGSNIASGATNWSWLWFYMSVLFLLFSVAGELLCRKWL